MSLQLHFSIFLSVYYYNHYSSYQEWNSARCKNFDICTLLCCFLVFCTKVSDTIWCVCTWLVDIQPTSLQDTWLVDFRPIKSQVSDWLISANHVAEYKCSNQSKCVWQSFYDLSWYCVDVNPTKQNDELINWCCELIEYIQNISCHMFRLCSILRTVRY